MPLEGVGQRPVEAVPVLADKAVEHLHWGVQQLAHRLRVVDGFRVGGVDRGHQLRDEVLAAEPIGLEGVDPGVVVLPEA